MLDIWGESVFVDGMHGVWDLLCLFYYLYTSYFLGQEKGLLGGKRVDRDHDVRR